MTEWVGGLSPFEAIGWLAAVVFFVARIADALERVGRVLESAGKMPERLRGFMERRAARVVAQRHNQAALAQLIEQSPAITKLAASTELILQQVTDSPGSLRHQIKEIAEKLDAHLEEDRPLVAEHREIVERVGRIEGRLGIR